MPRVSISSPPVDTVFFDAVGTIIHAQPAVDWAYWHWARQFGSVLPRNQIADRFARAFAEHSNQCALTGESEQRQFWRRIVHRIFADSLPGPGSRLDDLFEALWEHFANPSHWRLYADVDHCWRQLWNAGLRVGVASNFDSRLAGICASLPVLADADFVFHSAMLGFQKPDPRFFRGIEQLTGRAGAACLLIGDQMATDVQGAADAGWHTIWLRRAAEADDRQGSGGRPSDCRSTRPQGREPNDGRLLLGKICSLSEVGVEQQ